MAQFDVYTNTSAQSRDAIPFLLDVQAELLDALATRVVVPLIRREHFGTPALQLNPEFNIDGIDTVMSAAELAGVPVSILGNRVISLKPQRYQIMAALDLLITGI